MTDPAAPTARDLAEFARLALEYELLPPEAVVRWADETILAEPAPPAWVIDLSLAPPDRREMIDRLRRLPGEPDGPAVVNLFLALVRREWDWVRLPIATVQNIARMLHVTNALPGIEGKVDWCLYVAALASEMDDGCFLEAEVIAVIDRSLAPYRAYEPLLPDWAQPGTTTDRE